MSGLNHDFLVIDKGSFSLDKYDIYNNSDKVELHDDFLGYIGDSLSWVNSFNPFDDEQQKGLCWYGSTIIDLDGIVKFEAIVNAWRLLFDNASDPIKLKGTFSWVEGETADTGTYEMLEFNKFDLVKCLSKLSALCQEVKIGGGQKSLLHIGI